MRRSDRKWVVALAAIMLFAVMFSLLDRALHFSAAVPVADSQSIAEDRAAFAHIHIGHTAIPDLAGLGFDAARPGVQTLSYLGVMEHFMPRTAADFDKLDPAVRACLSAAGRCTAYMFPLGRAEIGNDDFGFSAHAATLGGPHILFLIRGGRVAYKAMSGA